MESEERTFNDKEGKLWRVKVMKDRSFGKQSPHENEIVKFRCLTYPTTSIGTGVFRKLTDNALRQLLKRALDEELGR
jgi:hypothetical protein